MQIVTAYADADGFRYTDKAFYLPRIPASDDELQELVTVLTGGEGAAGLMRLVKPGTLPDTIDAKTLVYVVLGERPSPTFGYGVWGIMQWVRGQVEPAMPQDWGVALSVPMIAPLIKQPDGRYRDGRLGSNPDYDAYMFALSPMDRTVTDAWLAAV
jgi:hypothetical protein